MKIEKLPSGSYRVQKQFAGRRYNLTFDHSPKKKEIEMALMEKVARDPAYSKIGTIEYYSKKYIQKKKDEKKSDTTIKAYESIFKNTPKEFKAFEIGSITNYTMQILCDEYFKKHSAKSTRNYISFYSSVLAEYRPSFILSIKLPPNTKKMVYEPTTKDVKRILKYSKGSDYELLLRLCANGLRRGEACAITSADITDDNILTVNKDKIIDLNNKQVIKDTPKTSASNRRILIPADIADMIREKGFVYDGYLNSVNKYLRRCQDALDIPHFTLHTLRHFAAALMLKHGFTVIQIEDYMGWEHGSKTMEKVYAYNLDPEESQADIANVFSSLMD